MTIILSRQIFHAREYVCRMPADLPSGSATILRWQFGDLIQGPPPEALRFHDAEDVRVFAAHAGMTLDDYELREVE